MNITAGGCDCVETHEINATINFPAEWLNYTTDDEKSEYAAKMARIIENQIQFDLLMDIFEKNGEVYDG